LVLIEPPDGLLGRGDTDPGARPHQLVRGGRVGHSDIRGGCLESATSGAESKAGSKKRDLSRCRTRENLARRPKKKVVGPNASMSTAPVDHIGPVGYGTILELPGEPMGPGHPTAALWARQAELSIASMVG
jgi:hypothetical protein